jgi:cob(I)alamin adenosyltransferase
MKLYTRNGDDGKTSLIGGGRVSKDHPRVEAYAAVDECNCAIGVAVSGCDDQAMRQALMQLQNWLFDLGADLAMTGQRGDSAAPGRITTDHVAQLEKMIDQADQALPPLKQFILPGGCETAARLHLARAICRRAERCIITLGGSEPIPDAVVPFVNRLSDLLFALARRANQIAGVDDVTWSG